MHFDRNVHYLVSVLHLKDLLDVLEQSLGTPEMHCSVNMLSLKHLNRGWKHFGCWDLGLQNHGCIHPFVNDCTWETSIILRAVRIVWTVSVPPLVPPRPPLWAGCEGFTTPLLFPQLSCDDVAQQSSSSHRQNLMLSSERPSSSDPQKWTRTSAEFRVLENLTTRTPHALIVPRTQSCAVHKCLTRPAPGRSRTLLQASGPPCNTISMDFPSVSFWNCQTSVASHKPLTVEFNPASALERATFDCTLDPWRTVVPPICKLPPLQDSLALTSPAQSPSVQMCMA